MFIGKEIDDRNEIPMLLLRNMRGAITAAKGLKKRNEARRKKKVRK